MVTVESLSEDRWLLLNYSFQFLSDFQPLPATAAVDKLSFSFCDFYIWPVTLLNLQIWPRSCQDEQTDQIFRSKTGTHHPCSRSLFTSVQNVGHSPWTRAVCIEHKVHFVHKLLYWLTDRHTHTSHRLINQSH